MLCQKIVLSGQEGASHERKGGGELKETVRRQLCLFHHAES